MRWTPVVLVLVAIVIAVIVARGLPQQLSSGDDGPRPQTPIDDAARAVAPSAD